MVHNCQLFQFLILQENLLSTISEFVIISTMTKIEILKYLEIAKKDYLNDKSIDYLFKHNMNHGLCFYFKKILPYNFYFIISELSIDTEINFEAYLYPTISQNKNVDYIYEKSIKPRLNIINKTIERLELEILEQQP